MAQFNTFYIPMGNDIPQGRLPPGGGGAKVGGCGILPGGWKDGGGG